MGFLSRVAKGVATGGLSEVPGVKDYVNEAWDYGAGALDNVAQGAGLKTQKPSFDPTAASAPVTAKADDVYGKALAGNAAAQAYAGPTGAGLVHNINPEYIGPARTVAADTISGAPQVTGSKIEGLPQVTAGTVQAGDNVVGSGADALRQQRLEAAQAAASSPSAAGATMAAGMGAVARQQLGAAAAARGADRASARRAAVMGIGAGGMQASKEAAAMAASEQAAKAQAFSQSLSGVQASDVAAGQVGLSAQQANQAAGLQAQGQNLSAALSAGQSNQSNALAAQTANLGAWTDVARANQAANLQANTTNASNDLQRQQLNQAAGIAAGQANNQDAISAFGAATGAQNNAFGTALQAGGLQNQNLGVQAGYYGNYDQLRSKQNAAAAGTASSALQAFGLSDERTKDGITPLSSRSPSFADGYTAMLSSAYGLDKQQVNPWLTDKPAGKGQDFLQPPPVSMPAAQEDEAPKAGGLGGLTNLLGGSGALPNPFSDERTKDVKGEAGSMAAWADDVEPIAFRYKPGFADGGERGHVGVSAQQLESTGPLGEALVSKDGEGLRHVNYPETAFAMAVGAKERADEALAVAKSKKKGGE